MSRTLATTAALVALAGTANAVDFLPTSGIAQVGATNVTITHTAGAAPVASDGAVITNSYDCANAAGTAAGLPAFREVAGRAVTLGGDCGYVVPDGDGVTFFGGRVGTFGKFKGSSSGQAVMYEKAVGQVDGKAIGLAAASASAEAVNIEKAAVPLPQLDAPQIYQARVVANCEGDIKNGIGTYTYDAADPTKTPGYLASGSDFDNPSTGSIPAVPGVNSLETLEDKSISIGTFGAGDINEAFTVLYCGRVIVANGVQGYVAAKVSADGTKIDLEGYVSGLPTTMTDATFHIHEVARDVDNNGRKFPVCDNEESVGDHLPDSAQNDNFAQQDGASTLKYTTNGAGAVEITGKQVVVLPADDSGTYAPDSVKHQAVIFHSTEAGNELQYELKLACANLNDPPPFGGVAPSNPPSGGSGAASYSFSGAVAMAVAIAAYFV